MGDQTITTISTPTLSLSSLTMMFIHQILCLAVIATRVRSMQEHRYLQSSPTFQKMVYDEDMRCARIVHYNPVNRRRLGASDSYSGPGAAALYHCNKCQKTVSFAQRNAEQCSNPKCGHKGEGWKSTPDGIAKPTKPTTTRQSYEGSSDNYKGSPDNDDAGYSASTEVNSVDSSESPASAIDIAG